MHTNSETEAKRVALLEVGAGIVAVAVVIIASRQGVFVNANALIDDRLFLNHAIAIAHGQWLGDYNSLTLAKGPFYSIFLAVNYYIGLPVLISQSLLYLGAGYLLIKALQNYVKQASVLLGIFCLYAWNPYLFSSTRVIRDPLYTSLTVLVVAISIGTSNTLLNQSHSHGGLISQKYRPVMWSILLGVTLACFWMTREEGIWILPFTLPLLFISGFMFVRRSRQGHPGRQIVRPLLTLAKLLLITGLAFSLTLGPVFALNAFRYGAPYITEMQGSNFKAAYGALTRVKVDNWHPYLPVPREARQKIYAISPSFKTLEPYLDGPALSPWVNPGCERYYICDDIVGGWFVWAFKLAVDAAGFYTSPQTASQYFEQLKLEINDACLSKQLACHRQKKSLAPRFNVAYFKAFFPAYFRGLKTLISNDFSLRYNDRPSTGSPEEISLFEAFLYNRANPPESELSLTAPGKDVSAKKLDAVAIKPINLFLLALIFQLYRYAIPFAFGSTVLCLFFKYVVLKKFNFISCINVLLLATVACRLAILTLIDISSFKGFTPLYLMPCSPLLYLFIGLGLYEGLDALKKSQASRA
ncbi:MAG: hypothetical protein AAGF01_07875 [Cyanobacteria bacterium P01_G01_bin.38]